MVCDCDLNRGTFGANCFYLYKPIRRETDEGIINSRRNHRLHSTCIGSCFWLDIHRLLQLRFFRFIEKSCEEGYYGWNVGNNRNWFGWFICNNHDHHLEFLSIEVSTAAS